MLTNPTVYLHVLINPRSSRHIPVPSVRESCRLLIIRYTCPLLFRRVNSISFNFIMDTNGIYTTSVSGGIGKETNL